MFYLFSFTELFVITGLCFLKLNIFVAGSVFNSIFEKAFPAKATFKANVFWTLTDISFTLETFPSQSIEIKTTPNVLSPASPTSAGRCPARPRPAHGVRRPRFGGEARPPAGVTAAVARGAAPA